MLICNHRYKRSYFFLPPSFSYGQTPEELEDDSDFEQEDYDVRSRTSVQTEDDQLIAGQSARVSGTPGTLSCYYSYNLTKHFCGNIFIQRTDTVEISG